MNKKLEVFKEEVCQNIFEIFERENLEKFHVKLNTVMARNYQGNFVVVPFNLVTTKEDDPVVLSYEKKNKSDDGWSSLFDINIEDLVKIHDSLVIHINFLKKTEPERLFNPKTLPIIYAAMEAAKKSSEDYDTILRNAILKTLN